MTRIAVWGATGFIGGALCAAAEARGWTVQRLPRDGAGAAGLAGVDIAYHCAGKVTPTDSAGYVAMTERFARACAAAGVRRLIYLSTLAVYGLKFSGTIDKDAPLAGQGAYAESRIAAERALQRTLAGGDSRLCIVRVPAILGRGMPGTVIRRFARAVGWGVFLHPGPADATLACLGVRRLAEFLLRLGELDSPPPVVQFCDQLRWADIARRAGELRGRRVLRIPLPALGGKLALLASTANYADDAERLFGPDAALPRTAEDLDAALRPGAHSSSPPRATSRG